MPTIAVVCPAFYRVQVTQVVFGVLAKTKSKFVSEALAEKASDREIV